MQWNYEIISQLLILVFNSYMYKLFEFWQKASENIF